jgi:hypothetical protein
MPRNKLSLKQVQEVLTTKANRSARSIAKEWGVSHTAIAHIRQGKTWKQELLTLSDLKIDLNQSNPN